MNLVYLQLGSNLGNRIQSLNLAIDMLTLEVGVIIKKSKIYESTPWGVEGQGDFLNQVVLVETIYSPQAVLEYIMNIEKEIGRIRIEKWGERIIDVDILFYNNEIIESASLCIPHKYISKRKFVLIPFAEIQPEFIHPKYDKTIIQLLNECSDDEKVLVYEL